MSAIQLAETLLNAGNATAALRVLKESGASGVEHDLLLARCCSRLGNLAGALPAYLSVLAKAPANVEAISAVGAIYLRQGLLDKAEAHFSRSLKKVDDDRLRVERAVVLFQRKQADLALAELARVIARSPAHFDARLQRASMLMKLDRNEEALPDLRELVERYPQRKEPWGLLGTAESLCDRYEEAIPLLREAVRLDPGNTRHLKSLAVACVLSGDMEAARAALEELRRKAPELWRQVQDSTSRSRIRDDDVDPRPLFLLMTYQQQETGNWKRRARFEEIFHDFIADPGSANPFPLAHCTGLVPLSTEERLRSAQGSARAIATGITPLAHTPTPAPQRLRVGYVLSRLGAHVVAIILRTVLAEHDRDAVEVHVIAVNQKEADLKGGMAQAYAAIPGLVVHDITTLDDAAAADYLRREGFDVLVDLSVYNDGARPGIMARRPAPVQVNFLGAPFTSGAPWLDYIITDPVVSPGVAGWCSEAEVRMPSCYFTYGHEHPVPPEVPSRSVLGLPEDRFLYSALNSTYKIDPQDFECWGRILAATPGSLLLLKDEYGAAANLRREAERRGIDPARLLFQPRVSHTDYLLRQGMPDLFLDTRNYGAHTTMAESLWMGVPGLSCLGSSFQNRVGASLLTACGLPELVAPDLAAYERLAIELFHDRERLAALRERLRATRLQAAPFDLRGQARHLEAAFRHMRQRFADGLPPAAFDIAALPEAGR